MSELPLLALAALLAGFIDAVAGGGGLVQVPALFNALPAESPATIFGTNKGSSVFGTANAAWRYARRIAIPWEVALPASAADLRDWSPPTVPRSLDSRSRCWSAERTRRTRATRVMPAASCISPITM